MKVPAGMRTIWTGSIVALAFVVLRPFIRAPKPATTTRMTAITIQTHHGFWPLTFTGSVSASIFRTMLRSRMSSRTSSSALSRPFQS
jgi:hypothetical protein